MTAFAIETSLLYLQITSINPTESIVKANETTYESSAEGSLRNRRGSQVAANMPMQIPIPAERMP
jgi:hypothetical protein